MSTNGLKFKLKLSPVNNGAERFTTAELTVYVDDEAIWPVAGAGEICLEIQVDDLLSYFIEFWQPLALRQTYPIAVAPESPLYARAEAERRWEGAPSEVAEREDVLLSNFEEAHDLSRCFAGYFDLPPLWLLRAGDRMIVDSRAGARATSFDSSWAEISRIGDKIVDHLGHRGDRWSRLIEGWRQRDKGDPLSLLAWSTSLDKKVAQKFVDARILLLPTSVIDAANDNDELRIAARMASALPSEQIQKVLEIVKGFAKGESPKLDKLSLETSAYIADGFARRRAHEQGEAAARFVREKLGLSSKDRIEIWDILEDLGVARHSQPVEPTTLRALAVWGSRHGPAVLLNEHGGERRSRFDPGSSWSARVTLAHELCHLLLDHGHALSAVEILNGKMPLDIERRAKSFAGEFLLPSEAAIEAWRRGDCPRAIEGLKKVINVLQETYGVTSSVAAWKLDHGLQREDLDVGALLDMIAPER